MYRSVIIFCVLGGALVAARAAIGAAARKTEARCAVKGHTVGIADATTRNAFVDHEQRRYFFCCGGCKGEFAADPERFAGADSVPLPANTKPLPDLGALEYALKDYYVQSNAGRTLLRFSSGMVNLGDTPIEVRGQAKGGKMTAYQTLFSGPKKVSSRLAIGEFGYHTEHRHWHLLQVAEYRLRDANGAVVRTSDKVSFCLMDTHSWARLPTAPRRPIYKTCERRRSARSLKSGISIGWADIYDKNLPGQSLDITGLPPGPYRLECEVNPTGILQEKTRDNNVASIPLFL